MKKLLQDNRREVLRIAKKYGIRSVRVFGSVARGDIRPDSDIDLLVDINPDRSLFDLGGFQDEISGMLDCPVDVVTDSGLRERMRSEIIREAVEL